MDRATAFPTRREDGRGSRWRWVICGLLFAATAINYLDRQMIGVLKPTLQAEFRWSEAQYADIIFWFQAAYAIGFLIMGRFVDRVGAKVGYAVSFAVWTAAHMAHGLATGVGQFTAARFALGLGEAGAFPSALKATAEWFPQRERALAVGILNAGANVGAIATPLLVPALTLGYGWRTAFVVTGAFGVVWLAAWLAAYRQPAALNRAMAAEASQVPGDPPRRAIPWRRLLVTRETWAYAAPKFLVDPIWWMFLFWLPDFLGKRYQLDLKSFGPPLVAVYLLSDLGSVAGGWVSSRLIRGGWSVNAARKLTMLGSAAAVLPVVWVQHVETLWPAVAIIGLATAGHQAFMANLLTVPSDLFPPAAVGSVVGIGGMAGAIGGMLIARFVGHVLGTWHSYAPVFAVAACAYPLALAVLSVATPRFAPARLGVPE